MNKIILVGRLTKDPELSATQNSSYVRFNLAVDRRFKRDGDEVTADFPSCIAWGEDGGVYRQVFPQGYADRDCRAHPDWELYEPGRTEGVYHGCCR